MTIMAQHCVSTKLTAQVYTQVLSPAVDKWQTSEQTAAVLVSLVNSSGQGKFSHAPPVQGGCNSL